MAIARSRQRWNESRHLFQLRQVPLAALVALILTSATRGQEPVPQAPAELPRVMLEWRYVKDQVLRYKVTEYTRRFVVGKLRAEAAESMIWRMTVKQLESVAPTRAENASTLDVLATLEIVCERYWRTGDGALLDSAIADSKVDPRAHVLGVLVDQPFQIVTDRMGGYLEMLGVEELIARIVAETEKAQEETKEGAFKAGLISGFTSSTLENGLDDWSIARFLPQQVAQLLSTPVTTHGWYYSDILYELSDRGHRVDFRLPMLPGNGEKLTEIEIEAVTDAIEAPDEDSNEMPRSGWGKGAITWNLELGCVERAKVLCERPGPVFTMQREIEFERITEDR